MQHGGAEPLRHKAAVAVFPEAHHGKANHLRAAAGRGCAAGKAYKPRRTERGAYCGAAYGQRERNADQHRYQNAHKERVHFGRAHYKIAKARHDGGYARPRKPRNEQPAHNCDRWRNKNINFCLF